MNVAVKIIEFQTSKGVETGLSAYFHQRVDPRPYGRVSTGTGIISAASLAYPSASTAGISLFLDRLSTYYGDFEVVLQALVDQNRAFILSQPKVMVPVGLPGEGADAVQPTIIKTTQSIPYENTVVVGTTALQTTAFETTGVTLTVSALQVADDDGDPNTQDDIFIQLQLSAEIMEEGSRVTVALDDSVRSAGAVFTSSTNAISVPEFVSRSLSTTVWVRNGQVLILGGLYRNTKNKNLATLPWLTQGENILNSMTNRLSPVAEMPNIPLASTLGNQDRQETRRELVFLIKAELWRKAYTVTEGFDLFEDFEEEPVEDEEDIVAPRSTPRFIEGILESLSDDHRGIGGTLGGRE